MRAVHTIWVPLGWSIEQVWEHLRRDESVLLDQEQGVWVNVDEEGVLIPAEEE